MSEYFDIVIVGAGLSGICTARHLVDKCPDKSFAILESRNNIGGTWDLFRYPGVRSDSDMFTLGYEFKPWPHTDAIAGGDVICEYIREAAVEAGLDSKIRYQHKVTRAQWHDETACWKLTVQDKKNTNTIELTCQCMMMCTGYYEIEQGYTPDFTGVDSFTGSIVHPQLWPADLDYSGKRVVVIGSGATAVTVVPELADEAGHVVMLQRSPGYMMAMSSSDPLAAALSKLLPASLVYRLIRERNLRLGNGLFKLCRRFPDVMRKFLIGKVKKQLPRGYDMRHFTPDYAPWDQRLCLVPDGKLFTSIAAGRVSVVTDHIECFTTTGLRLKSGQIIDADIVVTATGLNLSLTGGIEFIVNGKKYEVSKHHLYKGMMLENLPNLFRSIGYTNASWTLKIDLIAQYACRLINHMDESGARVCVARVRGTLSSAPLLDMTSGYFARGSPVLPMGAKEVPWKLYNDYSTDKKQLLHGPLVDESLEIY